MVINLELEILIFVCSLREGSLPVYKQSLRNSLKWFFSLDHFHYAMWVTVHAFDLILLPIIHPHLMEALMKGKFSFAKSNRQFSRIALDQVHEQTNEVIKGQGGRQVC